MRKISSKIFWEVLAPNKLSKEEFKEYKKQADEGFSNKEDITNAKEFYLRNGEITAKIIGCKNPNDFVESSLEIWKMACLFARQFEEEKGITNFEEVSDEDCGKISKKMGAIGVSFARKRKCHFLRNGVVCYCDEKEK